MSRTAPGYEYTGLMAETWDLFRGDTSRWEDRFFYKEAVRRFGEPVLDVGCGTGRLVLDLLADGIDADGVDNSPEMLDRCRSKAADAGIAVRLYEQAMESLSLPRIYRTILVPSSSFQLVVARSAAANAMRRFFAHVSPGGALVMPFMIEYRSGAPLVTDWHVKERRRPEDGATMRRRSRTRYDPEAQLEHTEDIYEVWRDGVIVTSEHHHRSPAVRWYTQVEAAGLFHDAGFSDVMTYSGFSFAPARPDDALFTVIGMR